MNNGLNKCFLIDFVGDDSQVYGLLFDFPDGLCLQCYFIGFNKGLYITHTYIYSTLFLLYKPKAFQIIYMFQVTFQQVAQLERAKSQQQFVSVLQSIQINQPCLINLLKNVYSFATSQEYNHQKKQETLNKVLQLVDNIPKLTTSKYQYVNEFDKEVHKLSNYSSECLNPNFTRSETQKLATYLKSQILPYYQIFQFLLDQNQDFVLSCSEYKPIPCIWEQQMSKGEAVEVDSIDVLKEFVGQRVPKEEKKEVKKK